MSRYSGAAGRGASRTLAAVRRAEAETRQAAAAAERAERWERLHAAEHIKGTRTPRVELLDLDALYVVPRFDDERTYSRWIGDAPWQR